MNIRLYNILTHWFQALTLKSRNLISDILPLEIKPQMITLVCSLTDAGAMHRKKVYHSVVFFNGNYCALFTSVSIIIVIAIFQNEHPRSNSSSIV